MAAKPLHAELTDFLSELDGAQKRASYKKAVESPTTHPSKTVEDGTMTATEGTRSSENASQVKEMYGPAQTDSQESATTPTQSELQPNIGVEQLEASDSPVNEPISNKSDAPTTHPATTEDAQKYGAEMARIINDPSKASFNDLYKTAGAITNTMLTAIGRQAASPVKTSSQPSTVKAAAVQPAPRPAPQPQPQPVPANDLQKIAAVYAEAALRDGILMAKLAGEYLTSFHAEKQAQASGLTKAAAPQRYKRAADETDIASGETAKPETPPAPAEEPAAPPVEEGGSPSDSEVAEQLLQALHERGISPEEFLQMLQSVPVGGDPSGGGAPPMDPAAMSGAPPMDPAAMGGMPPGGGAPPMEVQAAAQQRAEVQRYKDYLCKVASEAVNISRKPNGKQWRAPKTAQASTIRHQAHQTIDEIFNR